LRTASYRKAGGVKGGRNKGREQKKVKRNLGCPFLQKKGKTRETNFATALWCQKV